jgi:hypothetical protein
VNDGNQAEPIPADIEHDIAIDVVGVLEHASDLGEIVPSHILDNPHPGSDLTFGIRVFGDGFTQMPPRHDVHGFILLHEL